MKRAPKWSLLVSLVPLLTLAVLILLVPNILINRGLIYTTIYIYISIITFIFLLRSKDYVPLKSSRLFDKIVTLIIWIMSVPFIIIIGIIAFVVISIVNTTVFFISEVFAIMVIYLFCIRLKIYGERCSFQHIAIVNHCSTIDDLLSAIVMGIKKWKVVFSPEITRIPFVRYLLQYTGIPLSRTEMASRITALRKVKREIDKGYNILIFPEGKRLRVEMKDELLLPFEDDGAFALSKLSGVPIAPTVISWTFLFKPRSGQWWFSPRTIKIYFLPPMYINKDEEIHDFKERVRNAMLMKLKESLNK